MKDTATLITLLSIPLTGLSFVHKKQHHPNVIIIMTDDHSEQALHAYGC